MDSEAKQEIQKVEKLLSDIERHTAPRWWQPLFNGALQGAGIVAGTVGSVFLLGWVLSIFGVIPGLGELAQELQAILNAKI